MGMMYHLLYFEDFYHLWGSGCYSIIYPSFSAFPLFLVGGSHNHTVFSLLVVGTVHPKQQPHFLKENLLKGKKNTFFLEGIRQGYQFQGKVENNEIIISDLLGEGNLIPTPCPISQSGV